MKRLLLHCILLSFVWFGTSDASVSGADEGLGIPSWTGWRPGQVSRADCPELRSVPLIVPWNRLEPQPGRYEFDKYFGEPLRAPWQRICPVGCWSMRPERANRERTKS